MDVGLYFDLREPSATLSSWKRRYSFTLELCEEAEHLGAASVWFTEHHGFDDGYLPQPLTMAAAVAARTNAVRIGTAVTIAPVRHPVHLAEEAAIVDLISGGRLELGLGAGYRHAEFRLFGADRAARMKATAGAVRTAREGWSNGAITPRPAQDPLPVWLGFSGPRGARLAGELGAGLLSLDEQMKKPYLQGLQDGGYRESQARMSGLLPAYPATDPEREWAAVAPLHASQWESYFRHAARPGSVTPRLDPDAARARGLQPGDGNLLFGPPGEVAARVAAHVRGLPVHTVLVWATLPGQEEDVAVEHVKTILTEFAPRLRAGS